MAPVWITLHGVNADAAPLLFLVLEIKKQNKTKPQEIIKAGSQKMSAFEGVNRGETFQP